MKAMEDEVKAEKSAFVNYSAELTSVIRQLSEKSGNSAFRNPKRQAALDGLKRELPDNVFGRLVDLCQPSHRRFYVPVTKILQKHVNSIVCDTEETAEKCIGYLKEHHYRPEVFLPIDILVVSPINEKLREIRHPPGVKLVFDVINVQHQAARKALQFVCGNALLCETRDDAKQFAYGSAEGMRGKRYKAVSMDGTLFQQSGAMSGGSADLRDKSKIWDEKAVRQLRENRDDLNEKIADLQKNRRKEMEVESVRSNVTDLKNRLAHFNKELIDTQQILLQRVQNELEGLISELEQIPPKIANCQERLRKSEAEVRALEIRSNEVADRIFDERRQEMEDTLRSLEDDSSRKSRNHSSNDSDNTPLRARRRVRRFSPQPSNPKVQEHPQRKRQRKMSHESSEESENRAPDNSSKRARDSSPDRSMNTEDNAPDDSSREPSNPETQQLRQPKEEAPDTRSDKETPIKTEPGANDGYTFRTKFLKTIQLLVLNLNMPIFTTLEARIQKKLRESTSAAKVSNDEISLTMELLLAKIASHSVTNSSENAESVRFSHFMCFLKAAILSSKMKGLENLLKKIDSKIKEPISMDKNIPVEKVATALHSILRATGF